MSFTWDSKRFHDPAAFRAYLFTMPPPSWCKRIIIHHTVKPLLPDWTGLPYMENLKRYYRDQVAWRDAQGVWHRGWSGGPHLFVAKGSPSAEMDGIYQGNPINVVGVHAGVCNDGIGIEVVGFYDAVPWSHDLFDWMVEIVRALLDWTRLPVVNVLGHRDCGSPKTCPGKKIDLNVFRLALINHAADPWAEWGDEYPIPVDQRGWDLAQAWLIRKSLLGSARSYPIYLNDGVGTVIQIFRGGVVVDWDHGKGRSWTWAELLG